MTQESLTPEQIEQLNVNHVVQMKQTKVSLLTETKEEREARRQIARGWRDANRHITESVRFLNGGKQYADIYMRDVYPHEATYIPEGMRLTRARIDSAIEFLEAIKPRVTQ